ncbi:MAG: hypothetical protein K2W95_13720 [Candidatus Obscuribacterales bacterium]|nr:hypothetical protein [Candidatus Obscuribacterales bacterium]
MKSNGTAQSTEQKSLLRRVMIATMYAVLSLHALRPVSGADWGYDDASAPASNNKQTAPKQGSATEWGYDASASSASGAEAGATGRTSGTNSTTESASSSAPTSEAIPATLQPGKRFELGAVTTNLASNEEEFGLPHWLGGTWRCETETKYPISGPLVNGVKHSRRELQTYGTFDNEKGWIYIVKVPRVHKIDEADVTEYRVEISRDFPVINDKEVVTKYTFYAVQVDKYDGLIVSTRKQNSEARITPIGKTEIQIAGQLTSLDTEGNAERSRSILRLRRVVEPNKPVSKQESKHESN